MSVKKAYNHWSDIYDTNDNKTRDLDRIATRQTLENYPFQTVIELGCGTGKNTEWFVEKAQSVIGLDFSEGMLAKAREKIKSNKVEFRQADLTKAWDIPGNSADLISCNLVLEHIGDLDFIFSQAYDKLKSGGKFFICELHPFKQYAGSKAKFETDEGVKELEVYMHHVSEFTNGALNAGFQFEGLKEWFDEGVENGLPRLISFVFEK
ncbi:MAG: hypothetical protein DHS20C18_54580 [Saprospiraceae bacterium]|nr:MAG: hypothetical protein DHS20C18_54580 [Saprospiraceae bacterium]